MHNIRYTDGTNKQTLNILMNALNILVEKARHLKFKITILPE